MRYLVIPGLVIFLGCQSVAKENVPTPAILSNPDNESHTQLTLAVSRALGGAPVTLSSSAFTHSSRLYLENRSPRDGVNVGPDGKKLAPARIFELLVSDGVCYLKTPVEKVPIELPRVRCTPVAAQ